MLDYLKQQVVKIRMDLSSTDIIGQLRAAVQCQLRDTEVPIRLAVTKSEGPYWTCEVGTIGHEDHNSDIFAFNARQREELDGFNVVMLVPTGIGAEVGGHAGDATPAATLLASVCDTLITHPNVLNASGHNPDPTKRVIRRRQSNFTVDDGHDRTSAC